MRARSLLEGAGISLLLLLSNVWFLICPHSTAFYHAPYPSWSVAGGLAVDLLLVAILSAAFIEVLDSHRLPQAESAWAIVLGILFLRACDVVETLLGTQNVLLPWRRSTRLIILVGSIVIMLLLRKIKPIIFDELNKAARVSLMSAGLCFALILPRLLFVMLQGSAQEQNAFSRPISLPPSSSERLVWILLDELSYDQVFEHRQIALPLPHFDQLRTTSVVYSNVQPIEYYTELGRVNTISI